MQTIHQTHPYFGIQQQGSTQENLGPDVIGEKKPDFQYPREVITQKIIKEKIGLVNPTGGQESCIPCSISGFNWLYFQKENPEPVDDIATPTSTWGALMNRPDYYSQRGLAPPEDYLTLDYPEQARRLPAAVTIKVERDTAVENGSRHDVGWTQETVIDDSRHYIFKKTTSDAFQKMLDKIPLKKWHECSLQAGLVNFFKQADSNQGHMVCFYVYKCGNQKPVKLLIDFQYRWVVPMSQLPKVIEKYEYNPVFSYWYNNPITPLTTTLSFNRMKTEKDPLELSSISVGAECFVISDDTEQVIQEKTGEDSSESNSDTHNSKKRFKCTFEGCESAFTRKWTLTTHMRTHTGEKPYKCTIEGCESAFSRKGNLTEHLRTHTGEKPYKCTVEGCESAFAEKGNLIKHLRTHIG